MKRLIQLFVFTAAVTLSIPASGKPPTAKTALAERILGNQDAEVTIIEYSSLTCSHCRHFHTETLPKLKKNFIDTGKVKLIFRDFPFDQLSLLASVMSRCAPPKQYFNFINVLFEKQSNWSQDEDPLGALTRIGKLGGLNPSDFKACLNNQELIDGIVEKRLVGQKDFDVKATPTFIIDGDHKIVGSEPYKEFEKILNKKLN